MVGRERVWGIGKPLHRVPVGRDVHLILTLSSARAEGKKAGVRSSANLRRRKGRWCSATTRGPRARQSQLRLPAAERDMVHANQDEVLELDIGGSIPEAPILEIELLRRSRRAFFHRLALALLHEARNALGDVLRKLGQCDGLRWAAEVLRGDLTAPRAVPGPLDADGHAGAATLEDDLVAVGELASAGVHGVLERDTELLGVSLVDEVKRFFKEDFLNIALAVAVGVGLVHSLWKEGACVVQRQFCGLAE